MDEISSLKRQRDETQVVEEREDALKRQKSYKDIITFLEEEEDVPNEDLSSLISTLQEEISFSSSPSHTFPSPTYSEPDPIHDPTRFAPYETDPENPLPNGSSGAGEEERESVMRHLLQASDDELGLPNTSSSNNNVSDGFDEVVGGGQVDGGDFFFPPVGGEGIWEFEDHEAVNYYSLLQQSSEIFM